MAYFRPEDLDKIRSHIDIVEVVREYVTLKRGTGGDWWGRCPFHTEKTPSFHISPDKGVFFCFGCGKGGNVFTFVMDMERVAFPEAVKILAERAGIELREETSTTSTARTEREKIASVIQFATEFYHKQLVSSLNLPEREQVIDYIKRRGISYEMIRLFHLGWSPLDTTLILRAAHERNISIPLLLQSGILIRQRDGSLRDRFRGRLIFPIFNHLGNPIALGGRIIEGVTSPEEQAKYINSPENALYHKGDHLYGLHLAKDAIRNEGSVWLVEGYVDLLAMVEAGWNNTVASLGTALTDNQSRLLSRYADQAFILYDSDSAGYDAAMRAAERLILAGLEVKMVALPKGSDPDSIYRQYGAEGLKNILSQSESFVQFHLRTKQWNEQTSPSAKIRSLKTLLEIISRIKEPLQQDILLRQLSQLTQFSLQALHQSMAQIKIFPEARANEPETHISWAPEHIPERDFIRTLIGYPNLIEQAVSEVTSDNLTHPQLRAIYQVMESFHLQGKPWELASLITHINDPQWTSFITRSEFEKFVPGFEEAEVALKQSIKQMKIWALRKEYETLQTTISQRSQAGEPITELLVQLNKVHKEIARLNVEFSSIQVPDTPRP